MMLTEIAEVFRMNVTDMYDVYNELGIDPLEVSLVNVKVEPDVKKGVRGKPKDRPDPKPVTKQFLHIKPSPRIPNREPNTEFKRIKGEYSNTSPYGLAKFLHEYKEEGGSDAKVKIVFKEIHKRSDTKGNMLIVTEEPVYGNRKVYIHLAAETRPRLIGEIDRQNKVMFIRRDKSKHLHYKMNSYGFNWTVINEITQFNSILMMLKDGDSQQWYMIPVKLIKENGSVKNFSVSGFELQVFLRIEYLESLKTTSRFIKSKLTP